MLATQVEYWKLQESKRHNVVAEEQGWKNLEIAEFSAKETQRHNMATEDIERDRVALGWASLSETSRHNVAQETETQRHNVAYEQETQRHNIVLEGIGWGNLDVASSQANEIARHNVIQEGISSATAQGQTQYWDRMATNAEQQTINQGVVGFQNASSNAMNAGSNAQNAESNTVNAETNRMNYELHKQKTQSDVALDWMQFGRDTALGTSKEVRGWVTVMDLNGKGGN